MVTKYTIGYNINSSEFSPCKSVLCFIYISVLTDWNRKSEIKRLPLVLRRLRISARVIITSVRLLYWLALHLFLRNRIVTYPCLGTTARLILPEDGKCNCPRILVNIHFLSCRYVLEFHTECYLRISKDWNI